MGLGDRPGPGKGPRRPADGKAPKGTAPKGASGAKRSPEAERPPAGADLGEVLAALRGSLAPHLASLGLELLSAKLAASGSTPVLRLVIEKTAPVPDGAPAPPPGVSRVTIDDCAALSRRASAILDELYPGDGPPYSLEVSSPGLDRSLEDEADLRRCDGALAKLKLDLGDRVEVRVGRLLTGGAGLRLATDAGELAFEWAQVRKARLVPEL
jgi:ribosome maturation factor RimP